MELSLGWCLDGSFWHATAGLGESAGLALLRTKEPPKEHCFKSFASFDRLEIAGSQPWKKQPRVERPLASHSIVSTFEARESTEIVQLSRVFRRLRICHSLELKNFSWEVASWSELRCHCFRWSKPDASFLGNRRKGPYGFETCLTSSSTGCPFQRMRKVSLFFPVQKNWEGISFRSNQGKVFPESVPGGVSNWNRAWSLMSFCCTSRPQSWVGSSQEASQTDSSRTKSSCHTVMALEDASGMYSEVTCSLASFE